MRSFLEIFNVFSKRPEVAALPTHEVPASTRNRVLRWCTELFRGERPSEILSRGDHNLEFWQEIYRRLLYRTGKLKLTPTDTGDGREAIPYILNCPDEEFLDFLEDIFNNEAFSHVNMGDKNIVDELNDFLRQDKVPYSLTYFVWETYQETSGHFAGLTAKRVRAYPKVIMKESEALHETATAPALRLLEDGRFAAANLEFLAALEDYRKGDYGDCLTKCASAFESVLKVICDCKAWPYKQTDTAGLLIKTVVSNTALDNYFEPVLLIIATLRNRLSTAHGGGTATPVNPPRHLAQYALNMTAIAIVMLVAEANI
jgi:hypothetical protein